MTPDFLVIGGGVIGTSVARELRRRFSDASVHVCDKELTGSEHGSGRNSGVVHAGFYYTADSLKAQFTREGNRLLTEYCLRKKLPINRCGKLIVTQAESDLPALDELVRRGAANGVELHQVTLREAREIEPRVKTVERALFSPTTSSVNPSQVMKAMMEDAEREGVVFHRGAAYLHRNADEIVTSQGTFRAGYVVNAAGLYADKVAKDFGFSEDHRILPFKGLYIYSDERDTPIRTNIYPVPNLANPFLGVHFTVTVDGEVKIGPTAIPAFWREQYSGLSNFKASELFDILGRQLGLFFRSEFDFKRLAFEEVRKYYRPHLVKLSKSLATGITEANYRRWGRPGIRAQLLNTKTRQLEMDFLFEGDARSFHILNAVSPGFTCSIPFSKYVCDHISRHLH